MTLKTNIPVLALCLCMASAPLHAQQQPADSTASTPKVWTLDECLNYALENNLQMRQQRNTMASGQEDTYAAKWAFAPSVSAGVSQNGTHYAQTDDSSTSGWNYNGSYNLSADMTLFAGGKLIASYRQSQLQNRIDSLSVEETANDIRISIVQAYMQCLYARESILVNEGNVESSKLQMDRGEQLWRGGMLSKVDYAQLKSQYQSDCYQLVVANNSYATSKLTLKQLLELDIMDEIELTDIEAGDDAVLALIPNKAEVFAAAKEYMPQMLRYQAQVSSAEYDIKKAQAGYMPTLSLSAGVGTSNRNAASASFTQQLGDNLNESIGLSLRIPIFSQMQNRTAVRKAQIAYDNTVLQQTSAEKELLKEVESTYLDVLAAQSQYISAKEKCQYARESYELTYEQFSIGSKNIVELTTAQNEYASARQQVVLAKYTALQDLALLDIYQGKYTTANVQ